MGALTQTLAISIRFPPQQVTVPVSTPPLAPPQPPPLAGSTSTMSLRQYVTPRLIRDDPALVMQILDLDFFFMAAV